MTHKKIITLFVILLIESNNALSAGDIFNATLSTAGTTQTLGFSTATDVINSLNNNTISTNFPGYVKDVSPVTSQLDFRGLPLLASYGQNSTTLNFAVPALGINQTFSGLTRKESANALLDFLKKSNLINQLFEKLAAVSPTDPLAGNPSSLMGQMVDSGFSKALTENQAIRETENLFSVGTQLGRYIQGGKNIDAISLPAQYDFSFDSDKKNRFILSMPITYTNAQGAQAYKIGLGLAYKWRILEDWTVMPEAQYGVVGSLDLISVGQVASGTLTSVYKFWKFEDKKSYFSIANMAGYFKTLPINIGNLHLNPNITNYVTKNGVIFNTETKIEDWDLKLNMQAYVTDTEFFGSKLYARQYNEVGFSVNTVNEGWLLNNLGFNAKYIFSVSGAKVSGFNIGLKYVF